IWGKNAVIYTLDVKKEVPYELVADLIRKTQTETNTIIITYSANQAAVVNLLAPDLMISASIKKPDDLTRLSNLDIPDNRLVAFVGTSEPEIGRASCRERVLSVGVGRSVRTAVECSMSITCR